MSKAGWLPLWPPLSSGGAAGLVLCGLASGKAGDPSFDWLAMGGGVSRDFRAGLQSLEWA